MKELLLYTIALFFTVFAVNFISISNQVEKSAIESETVISNAAEAFLDKVADSGAVTAKDYTILMSSLLATGGTFDISITTTRLYPVPVDNEPGNFVMDYRPAYGWNSALGGIPDNYKDPRWPTGVANAPVGVQYLVKSDNVALVIKQVDGMDYQKTMVSRLALTPKLGEWSYSRAVRSNGTSIVGN